MAYIKSCLSIGWPLTMVEITTRDLARRFIGTDAKGARLLQYEIVHDF